LVVADSEAASAEAVASAEVALVAASKEINNGNQ
jgi:hypothetical protein